MYKEKQNEWKNISYIKADLSQDNGRLFYHVVTGEDLTRLYQYRFICWFQKSVF